MAASRIQVREHDVDDQRVAIDFFFLDLSGIPCPGLSDLDFMDRPEPLGSSSVHKAIREKLRHRVSSFPLVGYSPHLVVPHFLYVKQCTTVVPAASDAILEISPSVETPGTVPAFLS